MARCSGSTRLSVDWIIGLLSSRLAARTQSRKFGGGPDGGRKAGRTAAQDGGAVLPALALDRWSRPGCSMSPGSSSTAGPRSRPSRLAIPTIICGLRQVRALLGGQGWFDLRQHRFDPAHGGANIHWSRLVDLPLAGLILLMKPLDRRRGCGAGGGCGRAAAAAAAADVQPRADDEAAGRRRGPGRCRSSACSAPIRPSACSRR